MTPIGFDLTQFGSKPLQQIQRPVVPVQQPEPQPQPTPSVIDDPSAPHNLQEALTKPLDANVMNEDGTEFQDKLAKNAPGLKKSLWGIDKFAAPVRPIQVVGKDGKKIWVDGNGNNCLDPNTGEILTKPQPATMEDREELSSQETE